MLSLYCSVTLIVEYLILEDGISTRQGVCQFIKRYKQNHNNSKASPPKLSPEAQQIIENAMQEDDATQIQTKLALSNIYVSLATIVWNRFTLGWTYIEDLHIATDLPSEQRKALQWAQTYLHDNFETLI